ncbi:MAG: hypothetical protein ACTHQ3_07075 [Motilibacteraceae bacterium]
MKQDIEREILELADEDLYGLWEVGWRIRSACGVDPLAAPGECADVIESLIEKRMVTLYVREGMDGVPEPLASSARSLDLRDRSAWLVPQPGERQFLVGPPPEEAQGLRPGSVDDQPVP